MENTTPNTPDAVQAVLEILRTYDPVEGYAAGVAECQGRVFIPTEEATNDLTARISAAEQRLSEIDDVGERTACGKWLDAIRFSLSLESPAAQLMSCANALLVVFIKNDQRQAFVPTLLSNIASALELENSKWQGHTFSGEESKAVADGAGLLNAMLELILKQTPEVQPAIEEVRKRAQRFQSMFPTPPSGDLDELFSFFQSHPAASKPSATVFSGIIEQMYDYGANASDLLERSREMLKAELQLIAELRPQLVTHLGLEPKDTLGDVYEKLTGKYQIADIDCSPEAVLNEAEKMMKAVNQYLDRYIQDIPDRRVTLRPTPDYLQNLVTSGGTVAVDYLSREPKAFIFITEQKNTSWLTLLNVLVHEATHAYQPIILNHLRSVPELGKLRNWMGIPFMEATAFHREFEIFEAVKKAAQKRHLDPVENQFLKIFDAPKFELEDDVNSFELETRVWRVMRALRTICDVEVNSGCKTYVEFVNWAVSASGLKKQFIHENCFTFLVSPGYTPSYSFCGGIYADLQSAAALRGVCQFDFNTQANGMGLWAWTLCETKMQGFRPQPSRRYAKE
jgi:hypothetical protein